MSSHAYNLGQKLLVHKVATIVAVCIVLVLNMCHPAAATECEDCLGACVAICIAYTETTCSGICTVITFACQECKDAALIECGATCYGGCTLFC
ncbi:hypothetical protein CFC21_000115 [Triticum aestivum]|uniref:Thionin-like protein n=1 Tax=Triticum aestivum TaxID=4565 RepID=A0A3B5XST6_WHEAT|nr:hypothetical protein CFC21_000115 [Triticum aestivum]